MEEKKRKFRAIKWTLEACKIDALKYKSKKEWSNNSSGYERAYKNKWLNQCCGHMTGGRAVNGYWTLEKCKEEVTKFKSKSEWRSKSGSSYTIALKNGWIDECCPHIKNLIKPNGYWNLDTCKQEALKYPSKELWHKNGHGSYAVACQNKWVEECVSHMVEVKKPNGYWTKERCHAEALKYKTRGTFKVNSSIPYDRSIDRGWLDEVCSHMEPAVYQPIKWTFEACIKDSLKYKSKKEWSLASSGYKAAWEAGWIKECCAHMKNLAGSSKEEREIYRFAKSIYDDSIKKRFKETEEERIDRLRSSCFNLDKIKPPCYTKIRFFDLDIYIPSLNKGIEFNGTYWHGKGFKRKWTSDPAEYHEEKRAFFKRKGIPYIEIEEVDWKANKAACLQKIADFLTE
jgi:hypothetical protein